MAHYAEKEPITCVSNETADSKAGRKQDRTFEEQRTNDTRARSAESKSNGYLPLYFQSAGEVEVRHIDA